jgi:hypothetical protein
MNKKRPNEGILKVVVKITSDSKNVKRDIQTPATFFLENILASFSTGPYDPSL